MKKLKLKQIGNALGVILPKEVLARLKLDKGDTVFVTDGPDGITLTACDPALTEQLERGREIMRRRRSVLRQLAK